jgi:hypothetical protein
MASSAGSFFHGIGTEMVAPEDDALNRKTDIWRRCRSMNRRKWDGFIPV